MKKICLILCICLLLALFGGCGTHPEQTEGGEMSAETAPSSAIDAAGLFTDRDYEVGFDESEAIAVTLSGETASCNSGNVAVSQGCITITQEGTYILRGSLTNGSVVVDMDKNQKVRLVLDGASIHSEASAPIYIRQGDKVFLTTAPGSENTLSNGGSFTPDGETNIDGALFSREDLTLNGTGSLTITSPGGHGIVSKDELTITSGTYAVTAAAHGISGKDNVCIANADLTLDAGKDGIQAENEEDTTLGFVYIASGTFQITAAGDGISASGAMKISGGDFRLLCGGGAAQGESHQTGGMGGPGGFDPFGSTGSQEDTVSSKGLKATGNLTVSGGSVTIDSADDAIHANASIAITGGTYALTTGDDGIHADETLAISEGTISVSQSYEGLEALNLFLSGGDIHLTATDDGINAAGGTDSSGFGGMFGGDAFGGGRPGGQRGEKPGEPPTGQGTAPGSGQNTTQEAASDAPGGPGDMGGGMGSMSVGNGSIVISGGSIYVNASGDGIDANGYLEITGGYIVVCGPTQGDTATLDYDTTATITGGTFIGTGASGMAQTFSDSEQGVYAVSVGSQSAGTQITLADASGRVLLTHTPELDFSVVILSCPELVKGESYTITVGKQSETFEAQ